MQADTVSQARIACDPKPLLHRLALHPAMAAKMHPLFLYRPLPRVWHWWCAPHETPDLRLILDQQGDWVGFSHGAVPSSRSGIAGGVPRGRVKMMEAPPPGACAARIAPPCASMMARQIARPRPTPGVADSRQDAFALRRGQALQLRRFDVDCMPFRIQLASQPRGAADHMLTAGTRADAGQ